MTPEQAAALRAQFPESAIGTLPKPYSKDSPKANCRECGGYHGMPAAHLSYVGHAAATDRLLQVDPAWSWEPFAVDAQGLPAVDRSGDLWIKLTVCGVTRPGVGDGPSMKVKIGDAIRNAAMRFGVALDLWAKEDLWDAKVDAGQEQAPAHAQQPQEGKQERPAAKQADPLSEVKARAWAAVSALYPNWTQQEKVRETETVLAGLGATTADATVDHWMALAEEWERAKAFTKAAADLTEPEPNTGSY